MCVCVCVYGACMRACVCEFYEESIFSVSFRSRILTFYILAMTNPKMTIIQTAGDYVLNALLVASLVIVASPG